MDLSGSGECVSVQETVQEMPLDDQVERFEIIVSLSQELSRKRNWGELHNHAQTLRAEFPDRPEGFLIGKAALLGLGQLDAADALAAQAVVRFPDHEQLAVEHAWLAHERRDWAEAIRRWGGIKERFPHLQAPYVGLGIAQRDSRLFDEADSSFTEAITLFPNNPAPLIEYAWVAHQRGNVSEARARWSDLRSRFPENRHGYLGAGVTEQSAGEFASAETVLSEGLRRFPNDEAIAVAYAWIANLQQDWRTAVARWSSLTETSPSNEEVRRGLEAALQASKKIAPAELPVTQGNHTEGCVPRVANVENGVLIGHNNTLFLAEGGHAVLDFATGRRTVPEESYGNFLRNLVQRHRAATSEGAKFQHVIFPDKHSVCTEDFPIEDPILLGVRYLERFPALAHYICYPRDELRQATRPSFMRTDTHVTDYGTILVCAEIVRRLVGEPQTTHVSSLIAGTNIEADWSGDLGSKLTPPHSETRTQNPMKWLRNWYHNNLTGGNNGIIDIYFNNDSVHDKRLVWFGDSFGRSACQFMAYFFREVTFFRTPFFHPEIFDQIRPDYLVTQNAERYLNFVHSDEMRPAFFMYPHLSNLAYQPGAEFAAAMSAVLSYGRKPYVEFLAKIGM
jgi:tetratricopeptide (TPR) repeat protein